MLNKLEILKEARGLGADITLADVENALANYDYERLKEEERKRYRVELYDKVSDINGIPAEKIMEDVPQGGEVYLIYIDNKLIILQKHDPEQIGFAPMSPQRAMEVANKVIDDLVEQTVDNYLKERILLDLLS